jgi:hypothetical protein
VTCEFPLTYLKRVCLVGEGIRRLFRDKDAALRQHEFQHCRTKRLCNVSAPRAAGPPESEAERAAADARTTFLIVQLSKPTCYDGFTESAYVPTAVRVGHQSPASWGRSSLWHFRLYPGWPPPPSAGPPPAEGGGGREGVFRRQTLADPTEQQAQSVPEGLASKRTSRQARRFALTLPSLSAMGEARGHLSPPRRASVVCVGYVPALPTEHVGAADDRASCAKNLPAQPPPL